MILPIYDILGDYPEIRHVLVRHEQGGGHAADGYARASNRVGVCMGTSGPGATNLVTAIATAQLDSIPMVAITGNVPNALLIGASVALVPPRSSVLPPGAGNEPGTEWLKAGKERAKKIEERYVPGIRGRAGARWRRAPIGRHDDGDAVPAVTLEEVQATQLLYTRW